MTSRIPYNYIAIEGNIGAGKTSLCHKIAEDYNGKLILEQFEDNPFLPKFYEDAKRFAFPLELSFLASRFQQLKDNLSGLDVFKDFIMADYYIVKSLLFSSHTLQGDEYQLFKRFYDIITSFLPKPEMIVYLYLSIPNLLRNIEKRGRGYEQNISAAYLEKVQNAYLNFFRSHQDVRVLIIDTNGLDFVNNAADYEKIVDIISRKYPKGVHHWG